MSEQNAIILQQNDNDKEQDFINLMKKSSQKTARELIKYNDAKFFGVLPLSVIKNENKNILTVASSKSLSKKDKETLKFITNNEIKDIVVQVRDFENVIFSVYHGDDDIIKESLDSLLHQSKEDFNKEKKIENFFDSTNASEGKFLENIIKYAISIGASDLHIIPFQFSTQVKLRVNRDFIFLDNIKILKSQHERMIRRIKVLCQMRLDKIDIPQDGSFIIPELKNFSIRVSTMPTIFGEKAVLRLHSYNSNSDIFSLGLNEETLGRLKNFLDLKSGAMLCAGPTGSGKTTTLYAMLNYLKSKGQNVVTIEDPVELIIDGISQTSLNIKKGFDYKDALPAIFRQDPDVIMIGEVRDEISAGYLFQAVFSGHKVISTIHAGNVLEIFLRLKSLGINAISVAQALKFLSYQELVPKICLKCAKKNDDASKFFNFEVYSSSGCQECQDTGHIGKVLAVETLTLDRYIKKILMEKSLLSYDDLKNNPNFISFKNYAFYLLQNKLISFETFKNCIKDEL